MYLSIFNTARTRFIALYATIFIACLLFPVILTVQAATLTYTYDSLNRLTKIQYDNGTVIEYTYDAAGNRLTLNASVPVVQITVETSPSGLQVNVDGMAYTAPHTFTWEINSFHTLNIPSPQAGVTDTRYVFNAWSDGGTQSHTIQTPLSDTTYTASFNTQYVLTTYRMPGEGGIITPTPPGVPESCIDNCYWYDAGTPVALSAQPNGDYTFTGWGGDCIGTGACVVAMNGPVSVTATFDLIQYLLSINKTGTGDGSVTSNPAGINCGTNCSSNYPVHTEVTLSADPFPGSVFTGWSGEPDCSDGVVTMNAVKTCTATFEQTYTLTVNKAGAGSGTVLSIPPGIDCGMYCSTSLINGTVATLTAIPDSNSLFAGWSGDCSGTDLSVSVTMDAGKACTAKFIVGLIGEYYNNSGMTGLGLVRIDPVINFDWGTGSPDPAPVPVIDADTFAVRWTGKLQVDYNEIYTFNAITDDGVRLWIDGHLVLDYWQVGGVSQNNTMNLAAGLHDIKIEFFEDTGAALAQLSWSSPSTPYEVIPNNHFYLPDGAGASPVLEWAGGTGFAVDGVEPETGDTTTMFTYRVKYTDADGNPPMSGFPRVHVLKGGVEITGSPFAMNYESGGYAAGAVFSFSTTLTAGTDFTYYFDAVDNTGLQSVATPVTPSPTSPVDAPDVAGNSLSVTKSGTGSGRVTSSPSGIDCGTDCTEAYNSGDIITLYASPDAGSSFAYWSGDADCIDGAVAMDTDKTCTATFNISVTCGGKIATKVGTVGDDIINGTAGADIIAGLDGNDTINGLGGNDIICGGNGNDKLYGNVGADNLFGGNGNDTINGGPGNDRINGGVGVDTVTFATSIAGVTVNLSSGSATGDGTDTIITNTIENITGSNYNDTLTGDAANNILRGGAGNDTLTGLGGADTIYGWNGNDTLNGGSGNDKLYGEAGDDALDGGLDADTCNGGAHVTGDTAAPSCEIIINVP